MCYQPLQSPPLLSFSSFSLSLSRLAFVLPMAKKLVQLCIVLGSGCFSRCWCYCANFTYHQQLCCCILSTLQQNTPPPPSPSPLIIIIIKLQKQKYHTPKTTLYVLLSMYLSFSLSISDYVSLPYCSILIDASYGLIKIM
jgi:hypothetical protein